MEDNCAIVDNMVRKIAEVMKRMSFLLFHVEAIALKTRAYHVSLALIESYDNEAKSTSFLFDI